MKDFIFELLGSCKECGVRLARCINECECSEGVTAAVMVVTKLAMRRKGRDDEQVKRYREEAFRLV